MKNIRKVIALLLALTMVMAMGMTAFAEEGAPADKSISVTGLETGDVVDFFQVLKFDETATLTGGWVAAEGFTSLTTAQIQKMLGLGADGKPAADIAEHPENYGIDADLAAQIATMAASATAKLIIAKHTIFCNSFFTFVRAYLITGFVCAGFFLLHSLTGPLQRAETGQSG